MRTCPQCGLSLSSNAPFCPTCGWTGAAAPSGQADVGPTTPGDAPAPPGQASMGQAPGKQAAVGQGAPAQAPDGGGESATEYADDSFPWRSTLGLLAYAGILVAALAGAFLVRQHVPHEWSRTVFRLSLIIIFLAVVPAAIEVATMIHPATGRYLESLAFRAPDHWHRGMRRRSSPGALDRFALTYIIGFALMAIIMLSVWLSNHF